MRSQPRRRFAAATTLLALLSVAFPRTGVVVHHHHGGNRAHVHLDKSELGHHHGEHDHSHQHSHAHLHDHAEPQSRETDSGISHEAHPGNHWHVQHPYVPALPSFSPPPFVFEKDIPHHRRSPANPPLGAAAFRHARGPPFSGAALNDSI